MDKTGNKLSRNHENFQTGIAHMGGNENEGLGVMGARICES